MISMSCYWKCKINQEYETTENGAFVDENR